MATEFPSARHQEALSTPTGYRRFSRFTFSRNGVTLELESGLNDPMAVILTMAVTSSLLSGEPLGGSILLEAAWQGGRPPPT